MAVKDTDEILLINSDGIMIRIKASEVSRLGRATQGVMIMKVEEEANIIALAKVVGEDGDEEEADMEAPADQSSQITMDTES